MVARAYGLAAGVNAVNQSYTRNIRAVFSGSGIISKLMHIPLIMAKAAQIYYPSSD
jgi:hypothetical protein